MPITLQQVSVGTVPGDKTGDEGRPAFIKVNANSLLLEAAWEDVERKAFVISVTDEQQTIDERIAVLGTSDGVLRTFRMPFAFVLVEARASCKLEDSGGEIALDILENGVSVFESGDSLIIGSGSKTSVGYSPAPVIYDIILADDNEIQIVLLSQPSGGSIAVGVNVTLIGYVIWATF